MPCFCTDIDSTLVIAIFVGRCSMQMLVVCEAQLDMDWRCIWTSACVPVLLQRRASSILLPFAETTVLANDLKKDDFKVVSLHPGFVATDMGAIASDLMSAIRPGQLAHLP